MDCWHCGASVKVNDEDAVGFGATCEECVAWIHCCKGCQFYDPSCSQGCEDPTVDYVGDKEGRNLCESYKAVKQKREGEGETVDRGRAKKATEKFNKLFPT